MALPYHIYVLATAGTHIDETRPLQYGTVLVLIALVLGMNLIGHNHPNPPEKEEKMVANGTPIIEVENLNFYYGDFKALKGWTSGWGSGPTR